MGHGVRCGWDLSGGTCPETVVNLARSAHPEREKPMPSRWARLAFLGLCVLVAGCAASPPPSPLPPAAVSVPTPPPPPAVQPETPPPAPGSEYVWTPGHWAWR